MGEWGLGDFKLGPAQPGLLVYFYNCFHYLVSIKFGGAVKAGQEEEDFEQLLLTMFVEQPGLPGSADKSNILYFQAMDTSYS